MTDVLIYLDENIKQAREAVDQLLADFQPPVAESIAFLRSPEAEYLVSLDPYWPKWDAPWWHVLLLCELEASALVPPKFWAGYKASVDRHYLPFFPFRAEEVPAGKDPLSVVACHCYLGCLISCDLSINAPAPSVNGNSGTPQWMRDWFWRYQNADGGLNCDEDKYLKEQPTSSVVSTVPCLEAVLAESELREPARQFADGAAQYLLERRLCRSKRTGELINEGWLEPAFPRFYHYDVLRGLSVLTRWALKRGRKISRSLLEEALDNMASHMTDCGLVPRRSHTQGMNSRFPLPDGGFERGEASRFALLDYVDRPGMPSLPLTREWLGLLLRLKYMADARLLTR